jgi:hypothetical protein
MNWPALRGASRRGINRLSAGARSPHRRYSELKPRQGAARPARLPARHDMTFSHRPQEIPK